MVASWWPNECLLYIFFNVYVRVKFFKIKCSKINMPILMSNNVLIYKIKTKNLKTFWIQLCVITAKNK